VGRGEVARYRLWKGKDQGCIRDSNADSPTEACIRGGIHQREKRVLPTGKEPRISKDERERTWKRRVGKRLASYEGAQQDKKEKTSGGATRSGWRKKTTKVSKEKKGKEKNSKE